jgi:Trk K+ transport system NAD-binding subunit
VPADPPSDDLVGSPPETDVESQRFVVWGDNALARRLINELQETYGARVTVILPPTEGAPDGLHADGDRLTVVTASHLTQDTFRAADLSSAAAVALVDADDVANVDAALVAREVNPTIRIVLRMFNPVLGEGVTAMLGDCAVVSGYEIAAPAFVAAALGDDTPRHIRLPGQLVVVARRADVPTADIICGVAITGDQANAVTLPINDDDADLVLVRASGIHQRRRRRRHPLRATRLLFSRNLRLVLGVMTLLLGLGAIALAITGRLSAWQATYLAIITAFGGANPNLRASGVEQVTETLLAILGVAIVPALTAAVVEVMVKARLTIAAGGLTEPLSGHVIVVGLGNVGARVVSELHELGVDVVAVDCSPNARGVQVARDLGAHVIIGNANNPQTLRAASVQTCRALVVLSADDVANLETALLGRSVNPELRVVLRLFDEDFAGRVKRAFAINISRSVSYLAAPVFAATMLGREVIDAISVGRRVLLVAELPVGAGSTLDGRPCGEAEQPRQVRLIAIRTGRGRQTLWAPPERRTLVRTDRLLVLATRAGLAALLARTAGATNPPPSPETQRPTLPNLYQRRGEENAAR